MVERSHFTTDLMSGLGVQHRACTDRDGCIRLYVVKSERLNINSLAMTSLHAGARPIYMNKMFNPNDKVRVTFAFSAKMIERMRTVVYWTPTLTLTSLVGSAVESKLKKLEKGRRFRARKGKIRVGRPPKTARK